MLTEAARRDLITSLVLIEHGAMSVAGHEPVAEVLQRNRESMARLPRNMDPETYVRASAEPFGLPMPEVTPWRRSATAGALDERPCWDADIPLAAPAAASGPKLVITGTWETAEPLYWTYTGDPRTRANTRTADRIGDDHLRVRGVRPQPTQPAPGTGQPGAGRRTDRR